MQYHNISEFLDDQVDHRVHEWNEPQKKPRWQRLVWLMACNGGRMEVYSAGIIGYTGGPFKEGLTQSEAYELMNMGNFIAGASMYDDSFQNRYMPMINDWVKEQNELYNKHIELNG